MKSKFKFSQLILIVIILIGAFLRLYKLNSNPPSLFSDEVDAAYQAFTFNNFHSDYYGNKFPTHFHSFSDWRTPLMIYSISLSQKIFGLNEFSTRLPSVIFGVLTIFTFYLLIKSIFNNEKISLLGAFLITLSPWHIHYSRTAFEVSGMLFVLVLSIFFLIKYIKSKNIINLILFFVFSLSSIYFYSTAKLYIFLLYILFFVFYFKDILKLKIKQLFILFFLCLIILTPFIIDTFQKKSGYRFSYISIFSDPTVSQQIDLKRQVDAIKKNGLKVGLTSSFESEIFHNKPLSWLINFINHYLSSFSTNFLFIHGDNNLRQGFGEIGNLYYLDFIFIIFGIWYLLSKIVNNKQKKLNLFLFTLLMVAPIPYALTNDSTTPHATRLIIMLPFLLIISSVGLFLIANIFKNIILKNLIFFVSLILYFLCFSNFYHYYFYHYPQKSASEWHTGIKEAIVTSSGLNYSQIYYVNSNESFIPFFLFWTKYKPQNTNNIVSQIKSTEQTGFNGVSINNKYFFGHIEFKNYLSNYNKNNSNLFIVNSNNFQTIKTHIQEFNSERHRNVNFNIQREIKPPYEMSQQFTIFDINEN